MTRASFLKSDFRRKVAQAGDLMLRNRYYEVNPSLSDDGAALLARPGFRKLATVGEGPIRGLHSAAGAFASDLFVASGQELYRFKSSLQRDVIFSGLSPKGTVNMASTAELGDLPEYLFITDGRNLYVYIENGFAIGTLSGTPTFADKVGIGGVFYQFTNGDVDAGFQDGSNASPWLVAVGIATIEAFTNLYDAINASGIAGEQYSTTTTANPSVMGISYTGTTLTVRAKAVGAPGNGVTTTETGAGTAWIGATLAGGGQGTTTIVMMPEDIGVIDVAVISSYVIVIPSQIEGYQGRFYWINPGETVVDPLNFATAERSPDGISGVEVFGDQFWLPGEDTTEVWYPSGDPDNPMRRMQGVVLDRGSWESTATAIHESLMLVDGDGGVFKFVSGAPERVSTPDIEEQIREAIAAQKSYLY
jgi:hypothetical protein